MNKAKAAFTVAGVLAAATVTAFIAGIWTGDGRWAATACAVVGAAALAGFVGAAFAGNDQSKKDRRP